MSAQVRLITAIVASKRSVDDARDALRHINEPKWQSDFGPLLDQIDTVRARASKATRSLRDAMTAIGTPVKKLIGGVRVLVKMVRRSDAQLGKPAPPAPAAR